MSTLTMKPIQVYLRPEQIDSLRSVAVRRKVSIAEWFGRGLTASWDVPAEEDPLWDIIATFDSGLGNLAEKHDEYIARLIHEENHG